jgi:hypothetical protein
VATLRTSFAIYFRHYLGFRYHSAGTLAFLSVLLAFMVLDMIGFAFRMYRIEAG